MNSPFPIRGFNPCESLLRHTPEQLRTFLRRMKTLNMNTIIIHYDYGWKRYQKLILEECEKAGISIILMTFGPRTFLSYTDCKPQWLAKKEDGSLWTEKLECETNPCRFEPECLEAFEYGIKCWLKELPPQIRHIHMRAADGGYYCECPKCRHLPQSERWAPFVEIFAKTVMENRPDLRFETDIYYKRYDLPENQTPYLQMTDLMFDTFNRHNSFSLDDPNEPKRKHILADMTGYGTAVDSDGPNGYLLKRLQEWNSSFPNKVYIHENTMGQSFLGVFQHGTSALLKDLELYRKMGIRGVCYEAFEPGYSSFAPMFELLAKFMNGEEVFYEPTPLEKKISQSNIGMFCDDPDFPLEKWIHDPFQLKHNQLYQKILTDCTPESYREFVHFAFEHEEKLDVLFIGIFAQKWGSHFKKIQFKNLSPEAEELVNSRKPWDYMEKIPLDQDPIAVCKKLVLELVEKVTEV